MKRKPPRPAAEDASYEVGYRKPPKHTQFKPGQSGNCKGRPRGQRNFRTAVRDALQEKVTIREGDRSRSVSRMDAIIRVTFNNALRSDAKALAAFIQLARSAGLMDEEPELSSTKSISAEDEAILADYLERHGLKPGEDPPAEEDVSDK
jgi:Family of unknown function (DUF5681)